MNAEKKVYLPYKEARKFIKKFRFASRYDWVVFCYSINKDNKLLPLNANEVYENDWVSWKEFLGFKRKVPFLSLEEAKQEVQKLKLGGLKEWKLYCNWNPEDIGLKPANIPASPHIYYQKTGWKGYSDFLGTDNTNFISKDFRSFESARKYCRALGLTSSAQWMHYCTGEIKGLLPKPEDIPSNIARQYKDDGYQGMPDFLNTKYHREVQRRKINRSFSEARRFVHSLKLKNLVEWNLFVKGELKHRKKLPKDIPSNPKLVYKEHGWNGFGDWLGTYNVPPFKMKFKSFEKAREFSRKLGLVSSTEWIAYCKGELPNLPPKPDDIPHSVARHYQDDGWIDYKDFLMDDKRRAKYSKFLPYEEAKKIVNKLKLQNVMQWQRYLKGQFEHLPPKPDNIPSNPAIIYKDKGWFGMGDWLDNGSFPYANLSYRSFREARVFAQSLGLLTSQEWVIYCKGQMEFLPEKPTDIPANVVKQYSGKGWKGFKDFLNTKANRDNIKQSMDFKASKKWAKKSNIKSIEEWNLFIKGKLKNTHGIKPKNIPSQPEVVYLRLGWKSYDDWLGIK